MHLSQILKNGQTENFVCRVEQLFGYDTYQAIQLGLIFGYRHRYHRNKGWTLLRHARRIHIRQLWHRRALAAPPSHTTRKPILLLRLSRLLLLREAQRQFSGLLFQEPPRSSRFSLSLLYSLVQASEVNICWRNCQVSPCSK